MQCLSPYGSPIAERTSPTDTTSVLKAWDVATVAALKAIPTIDGTAATATTRPRYMTVPQGREERVGRAELHAPEGARRSDRPGEETRDARPPRREGDRDAPREGQALRREGARALTQTLPTTTRGPTSRRPMRWSRTSTSSR